MNKTIKTCLKAGFFTLALFAATSSSFARVFVGIGVGPGCYGPPPPAYYAPPAVYYGPGPGYYGPPPAAAWVPGYWDRGYWIPGHYVQYGYGAAPAPGPIWIDGFWDNGHRWHRGYWGHRH